MLHAEAGIAGSAYPFIALEGCDGVGKSTIRDLLRDELVRQGMPCMMVGQHAWLNPRVGRVIADVRDRRHRHSPEQVAMAYFRDKRLHAAHTIEPGLRHRAVIADRYIHSDAVYQELLYGIPAEDTLARHRDANTLSPSVILYVSVSHQVAYQRVLERSKHTRHYERPAQMTRIMAVYRRVLFSEPFPGLPPVVHFDNHLPNVQERVATELVPALFDALGLGGSTPTAS